MDEKYLELLCLEVAFIQFQGTILWEFNQNPY